MEILSLDNWSTVKAMYGQATEFEQKNETKEFWRMIRNINNFIIKHKY